MIKMVATDIDGTILKWDYEFSPNVIKCIKDLTKSGIKVVLVTGRMYSCTTFIADELGITTPLVTYQGGLIKDNKPDGKVYYEKYLDSADAKEIIKWAKDNNIHINLYMDDVLYVEHDDETIRKYTDARFIDFKICSFDDLEIKNVNKILAIKYGDAEAVTGWLNYLKSKYPDLNIVKSTPFFCEISNKDARKSCGVEFLRKMWDIKQDEVLAIGDQNNDIDLLQAGGIKVAMGNGTPELKEYADYITDTVENDGFVKAIEKFVAIPHC